MDNHEKWMNLAINQAIKAKEQQEVPVGAVIVRNGIVIAEAHNQSILLNDATAHAEILALRKAGENIKNYRLISSTLYVTLEPCAMCFGAMIHARIHRVVFGAYDYKTGVCGSCVDLNISQNFNHNINIIGGILEKESKNLLQTFFKLRR